MTKEEILYNIKAALSEKARRDTGMDVECWITSDLSAVVLRNREGQRLNTFTIPVVHVQEYDQDAGMVASPRALGDDIPPVHARRAHDEPQA